MKNKIKSTLKLRIDEFGEWLERSILSDKSLMYKSVFGPVQTERLGNVLGINNVSQKICSYNCVYCPLGKSNCCSVSQDYFLSPYELHLFTKYKLEEIRQAGKNIDCIVFSGSGEPTLDSSLSKQILLLREFGHKIAVATNGSLLWNCNVQENLMFADHVIIKIDTADEGTWLSLNRPHRRLNYELILDGIKRFSEKFYGTITTETTLVKNVNDTTEEIDRLSEYLTSLNIKSSYFVRPEYPSASNCPLNPDLYSLDKISGYINEKIRNSVILFNHRAEELTFMADFEKELLGLLSVQPVQMEAVENIIQKENSIDKLKLLIKKEKIRVIKYNGKDILVENYASV